MVIAVMTMMSNFWHACHLNTRVLVMLFTQEINYGQILTFGQPEFDRLFENLIDIFRI
jgi:hypothetical protein